MIRHDSTHNAIVVCLHGLDYKFTEYWLRIVTENVICTRHALPITNVRLLTTQSWYNCNFKWSQIIKFAPKINTRAKSHNLLLKDAHAHFVFHCLLGLRLAFAVCCFKLRLSLNFCYADQFYWSVNLMIIDFMKLLMHYSLDFAKS